MADLGRWCAACLAVASAALAQGAAAPGPLDERLLALCKSSDVAARRYCLEVIAARGDPDGKARETVADLAAHDDALRETAAQVYARLYGAARPKPPDAAKAAGDPMRVIYAPTAFTRPEGTSSFNAYELGTFTFDRGLSPNIALGLQTALPIGALVLGPTLRVGVPFEGGAVGLQLNAALFAPFAGCCGNSAVVVAGGGPMLTLGTFDRYLNVGAMGFVASTGGALLVPHAGFSVRVSPGARVGAELYLPAWTGGDRSVGALGKFGLLLWGVRLFGDSLWGDLALAEPICDGCGDVYRVLPIGIPFLNFGSTW